MSKSNKSNEGGRGFGIVEREVMNSPSLSVEAKCIYAFLCAYSDTDGTNCYPSVSTMCKSLRITQKRYYKHFRQLLDGGFLTVERKSRGNLKSSNEYTITRYGSFRPLQNDGIGPNDPRPLQNDYIESGHFRPLQNDHVTNNSLTNTNLPKTDIPKTNNIWSFCEQVCEKLNQRRAELHSKGRLKVDTGEWYITSLINQGITQSEILDCLDELIRTEKTDYNVCWYKLSELCKKKKRRTE